MRNSERIKGESEAIRNIIATPGMRVILSEIQRRIDEERDDFTLDDPNWTIKSASTVGGKNSLRELRDWVVGRAKPPRPASVSPPEA